MVPNGMSTYVKLEEAAVEPVWGLRGQKSKSMEVAITWLLEEHIKLTNLSMRLLIWAWASQHASKKHDGPRQWPSYEFGRHLLLQ